VPASAGIVVRAAMLGCRPRRDVCASPVTVHRKVRAMNRFVAPFSFTMAAAWVVVLFVLVSQSR
jgi:hypothetical protein